MPIKKTHQFAYNYNFPTLTENRNIKILSSGFSYLNLEEPITSLNATAMEWKEQQNFEYSLIIRWFVFSPIFLETGLFHSTPGKEKNILQVEMVPP